MGLTVNEQVWWYATRAAGLMTWSVAVAAVLLGLLLATPALGKKPTGPWLLDVHRFLGGLSAVFLILHLAALGADSQVDFGLREMVIPGESTWRPAAVAWGIGSAWTLIAVQITSILRNHIRPGLWKGIQYLSIVTVVAGAVHAHQAGTDADNQLIVATAVGSSLLVVLMTLVRMRRALNASGRTLNDEDLAEIRQRLDALPIADASSSIGLAAPDRLPTREPMVSRDLPTVEPPAEQPVAEQPVAEQPVAEQPVAEQPVAEQPAAPDRPTVEPASGPGGFGADPFAGLQASDDPFDPGGWSAESQASVPAPPQDPNLEPPPLLPTVEDPWRDVSEPITPDPPTESTVVEETPREPPHSAVDDGPDFDVWQSALESLLSDHLPESPTSEPPPVAPVSPRAADPPPDPAPTGPPPLPVDAIDPVTGEADEAVYAKWLVDWLAYAERYGDETPTDPTRIDG